MRTTTTLGTAVALLVAGQCAEAAASSHFPRAVAGDGYLSVPVGTFKRPYNIDNGKRASGNAIEAVLKNMEFFYAIELGMGTPAQSVTVLVDTGSSELWVNPDCTTAPSSAQARQCVAFGQYDPHKSKTPPVGPYGSEQINYGDPTDVSTQTSVSIRYYRDVISIGDAKISNQTFGVVRVSKGLSQGIMGLAPDVHGGFAGTSPYSLVLNTMAEQGVIASRVFALDLRHSEAETGAVIYGGLDRNKFIGSLETRPIVRGIQGEYRLAVTLSTLGITQSKSQNFRLANADTNVMLDSGTTLSRMHQAAALPILRALGARDDGEGYFYVPCSLRSSGGTVDFGFGNKTIRVPFSDFILSGDITGSTDFCYVGLVMTTDQQILGDSVLRAGYFVFDWDNEEVHIAQAADCGSSSIVAVGSGRNSVPDVQGNCKDVAPTFTPPPSPTRTAGLPTGVQTTVYTVTSCPSFDTQCRTGLVTTQTLQGGSPTQTAGGSGNESGDKNDGVRPQTLGWVFTLFGVLGVVYNTF